VYVPLLYLWQNADDLVDERAGPESVQDVWESARQEPSHKDAEGKPFSDCCVGPELTSRTVNTSTLETT